MAFLNNFPKAWVTRTKKEVFFGKISNIRQKKGVKGVLLRWR